MRWCRCLRSGENGDLPACMRRSTARPKSSNGSNTTISGSRIGMNAPSSWDRPRRSGSSAEGSICPVREIAETAISRPSTSAPESPMNSFAGLQFQGRKPMQAPMRTAAMKVERLK